MWSRLTELIIISNTLSKGYKGYSKKKKNYDNQKENVNFDKT